MKDEPNDNLTDYESFKSKIKIPGNTPADGNTKDAEIIVPLKYLSNFWRTFGMPLINCEINLILTCSSPCVITDSTGAGRFAITSTQDIAKSLQKLKSGFKQQLVGINVNQIIKHIQKTNI